MARRNSRSVRRGRSGNKDLIWITTLCEATELEASVIDIATLLSPADWSGNAGFDRCTLLAIRGWLGITQTAAATAADASGAFLTIYKCSDEVPAGSMNPGSATDYSLYDVIYTDGIALSQTTGADAPPMSRQLDIKAKRRLTSNDEIRMAAIVSSDTATPRVNYLGVLRLLLQVN